jgi:hypothetical protein
MPVDCTRVLLDSYCGLMYGKLENIIVFTAGRPRTL